MILGRYYFICIEVFFYIIVYESNNIWTKEKLLLLDPKLIK